MRRLITSLFIVLINCSVFSCNGSTKSSKEEQSTIHDVIEQDSIKRPKNVPKQATLINLGFDDLPSYQWVGYSGKLIKDDKVYPHIYGFKYFDIEGKFLHTQYYENLEIRSGSKNFDVSEIKVLPFPGDATIQLSNDTDTLLFFHVLESDEFKRTHKGIEYNRMPTIYEDYNGNGFASGEDLEFNIRKDQDLFIVTFTAKGILEIPFKLNSTCGQEPSIVSFMNREEGKIYFIEKGCYMEPVRIEDVRLLKSLN